MFITLHVLQRMKKFLGLLKVRYLRADLDRTIICVTNRKRGINGINNMWPFQKKKGKYQLKKHSPQKHLRWPQIKHNKQRRI